MINVKFLTGSKKEIDTQIGLGNIKEGDVIFTSDTDEIVFISPKTSSQKIIKSKTQKNHTLEGFDLGGLQDGATIPEGTDLDTLLEMISKKVISPEYEAPQILIEDSSAKKEFEVGEQVPISINSRFIKGDAGNLVSHNIYKNDELIYQGNNKETIALEIGNLDMIDGKTVLYSEAVYEEGEIKNNNFGQPDSTNHIAAGSIKSDNIEYQGFRKLFYGCGVGDIEALNSQTIRALSNSSLNPEEDKEFNVELEAGNQYIIIAYPSFLRDVKSIIYSQLSDDMTANFEQQLVNVEGANGFEAIEYKVYTYKTAVPIASKMTFKVTI